jgi:UDP-2,3-diacylglucosamine pyrophosphatase LpxH
MHNILVVSDVHLTKLHPRMVRGHQRAFAAFIEQHADVRPGSDPWLLVWNGDVLDFDYQARTMDGRGEEATALRLFAELADEWSEVFTALSHFLDGGNSLVVIPGNHDVDLMWPSVRRAFVARVAATCATADAPLRIEFCDWFYYLPGRIFAEHGQRFDTDAATPDMLDPFDDGPRLRESLSMHWIAGFCPLIPEIAYHVDHTQSPIDYVPMLARRYGLRAPVLWAKYLRFAYGVTRRAGRSTSAASRARHAAARARVAERFGIDEPLVAKLDRASADSTLGSRIATATRLHLLPATLLPAGIAALALGALARSRAVALAGLAALLAGVSTDRLLSTGFKRNDATSLRVGARRVQELLDVPVVTMGHVHMVEDVPAGTGRYLNSGTWMDVHLPATFVRVVGATAEIVRFREPSSQMLGS